MFLRDTGEVDQVESVLGMWMLSGYDVDRQVTSTSRASWKSFFEPSISQLESLKIDEDNLRLLETFTIRAVLDPGALYNSFYPVQSAMQTPIGTPQRGKAPTRVVPTSVVKRLEEPGSRGSLAGEDGENEVDRQARIRIAALGSMKWLLGMWSSFRRIASVLPAFKNVNSGADIYRFFPRTEVSEQLTRLNEGQGFGALLANVEFWTILSHKERPPFIGDEQEDSVTNYGNSQPGVRRAGWSLLLTLVQKHKGRPYPPLLSTIGLSNTKYLFRALA